MGKLNGRLQRLEQKIKPDRPAIAICNGQVYDVATGRPYEGDTEIAVIIAHVQAEWGAI